MAFGSSIVEEKQGKGHFDHGNGKGKGHEKHVEKAMADGVYEIDIGGVHTDNTTGPAGTDGTVTSAPLADGSTFYTQARFGSIDSTNQGLLFDTDNSAGRLRAGVIFDTDNQVKLGDLDDISFDFKVVGQDAGSAATYSPAFRIWIDGDGNLATTADQGQLVYEYAYNNVGGVPVGSTVHVDVDDSVVWQRANGQNLDFAPNFTTYDNYADADGFTPVGGVNFNEDSLVFGWEIGLGSGNGSGSAYVDNVKVGGVTYDFIL